LSSCEVNAAEKQPHAPQRGLFPFSSSLLAFRITYGSIRSESGCENGADMAIPFFVELTPVHVSDGTRTHTRLVELTQRQQVSATSYLYACRKQRHRQPILVIVFFLSPLCVSLFRIVNTASEKKKRTEQNRKGSRLRFALQQARGGCTE
jgi:hypothetical protein